MLVEILLIKYEEHILIEDIVYLLDYLLVLEDAIILKNYKNKSNTFENFCLFFNKIDSKQQNQQLIRIFFIKLLMTAKTYFKLINNLETNV